MDYTRRPVLAGKVLEYTKYATVRGSVRRKDPDVVSEAPYFPVTAGQTLAIAVNGAPLNAAMPANNATVVAILDALNTAFAPSAKAYEQDGVIYLQATTQGSGVKIAVTGGSAAAALGFDLGAGPIEAVGGEIPGAREGRIGNPFGAVFPVPGESLDTQTVLRALSRIAGNSDMLWGEHVRSSVKIGRIGRITDVTPVNDTRCFVKVPGEVYLFPGYTDLEGNNVLQRAFSVYDRFFGCFALCLVDGIVAAPNGDSVAGQLIEKGTVVIQKILNGHVLELAASVAALNLKPGDFVDIQGGNVSTQPWDNRGLRWAIERVIDNTHVSVRAMTVSERSILAPQSEHTQPILELNDKKTAEQTYGSAVFKTAFSSDVYLQVRPGLEANWISEERFDLIGPMRSDFHSQQPFDAAAFSERAERDIQRMLDSPRCVRILSAPGFVTSTDGPDLTVTVGEFEVEVNGHKFFIPTSIRPFPDADTQTVVWVWFDGSRRRVEIGGDGSWDPSSSETALLGIFDVNEWEFFPFPYAEPKQYQPSTITVGQTGMFVSLEKAIQYANTIPRTNSGKSIEIVLLENTNVSASIVTGSGTHIRGVTNEVQLIIGPGVGMDGAFKLAGSAHDVVYLEDLIIPPGEQLVSGGRAYLRNVVTIEGETSAHIIQHAAVVNASITEMEAIWDGWSSYTIRAPHLALYGDTRTYVGTFGSGEVEIGTETGFLTVFSEASFRLDVSIWGALSVTGNVTGADFFGQDFSATGTITADGDITSDGEMVADRFRAIDPAGISYFDGGVRIGLWNDGVNHWRHQFLQNGQALLADGKAAINPGGDGYFTDKIRLHNDDYNGAGGDRDTDLSESDLYTLTQGQNADALHSHVAGLPLPVPYMFLENGITQDKAQKVLLATARSGGLAGLEFLASAPSYAKYAGRGMFVASLGGALVGVGNGDGLAHFYLAGAAGGLKNWLHYTTPINSFDISTLNIGAIQSFLPKDFCFSVIAGGIFPQSNTAHTLLIYALVTGTGGAAGTAREVLCRVALNDFDNLKLVADLGPQGAVARAAKLTETTLSDGTRRVDWWYSSTLSGGQAAFGGFWYLTIADNGTVSKVQWSANITSAVSGLDEALASVYQTWKPIYLNGSRQASNPNPHVFASIGTWTGSNTLYQPGAANAIFTPFLSAGSVVPASLCLVPVDGGYEKMTDTYGWLDSQLLFDSNDHTHLHLYRLRMLDTGVEQYYEPFIEDTGVAIQYAIDGGLGGRILSCVRAGGLLFFTTTNIVAGTGYNDNRLFIADETTGEIITRYSFGNGSSFVPRLLLDDHVPGKERIYCSRGQNTELGAYMSWR